MPSRQPRALWLAALWLPVLLLAAAAAHAQDPLPAAVQAALAAAGLPDDAFAAAAVPLRHHDRPWQHQARRPMQPASIMKLVTTAVALDQLGAGHRGFTELRSAAPLQGDTLQGDLVLRGGGDVELGVPQLWALLLDLRQAGVRHIEGRLVVDRTRYRPARSDIGLPPFDSAPEFAYNVIPDALMLNEGLLPLELRATSSGVAASAVPALPSLAFESRMALVDAPCGSWSNHWRTATTQRVDEGAASRTVVTLNGAFPRDCTVRTRLQLLDRAELTERLFRSLWLGLGGSWTGAAVEAGEPLDTASSRVLARRDGRPWGELLRHVNKTSDNAWSRVLYLELGVPAMAAEPARRTQELADAAVRRWLAQHGIDDTGLVMDNGSGLSRSERISAWQLAQLLKVAHNGPHAPELLMGLSIAGVDGALRNRLKEGPAAGWVRLKTGGLRNVVSVAGYVNDPQGRPWAVVAMVNHDTLSSKGRPALDALVDHIARFGVPAVPAVPAMPGPQGDGP
jgi:D-alanyl-D-alanine carboxypeptidase/D-alanyl-D-alanine-endopeptidase (penicillin-binding protein 4)